MTFDPKHRRIRCIAHIINLSLQAFLLASSKEALIAALDAVVDTPGEKLFAKFYDTLQTTPEERDRTTKSSSRGRRTADPSDSNQNLLANFTGWQHIAPLRKVHGIAVWLRNSSLYTNLWDDEVKLRLGIDNATRWNSWYQLLDNLLRYQPRVKQFLADHDTAVGDNLLLASDWAFIEKSHTFLQPFASATLFAEGRKSTLSQSLTLMDVLLRQYEKYKVCASLVLFIS